MDPCGIVDGKSLVTNIFKITTCRRDHEYNKVNKYKVRNI